MDYIMWSIFLFLLRPYVVLILSVANRRNKMALIEMLYTDKLIMSLGAFAGIPAALLMYAWLKRLPGGSDYVRKIWKNGRELLAVSALLNALLVFLPLMMGKTEVVSLIGWCELAICFVIIVMLYKYTYIKDCFSEFPDSD